MCGAMNMKWHSSDWMAYCLSGWLTVWLTDWLTGKQPHLPVSWVVSGFWLLHRFKGQSDRWVPRLHSVYSLTSATAHSLGTTIHSQLGKYTDLERGLSGSQIREKHCMKVKVLIYSGVMYSLLKGMFFSLIWLTLAWASILHHYL